MPDTVYGPWEQEEGSDYDEQKPGSGDSHEDEFDDEYGEQQPKGDPARPDNALEDAYQADVDYWEAMARLNAIARPFDPGEPFASDAAALNPYARPFDPGEPFASDAAALNPFADALEDSSSTSLSSQLSSLDPDDFDRAESVDHVGPPIPDSAAGEPATANSPSFDPAVQFTDALGDSSLSLSSPVSSPDRIDADDSYQTESIDPPILDSAAGASDAASSQSFDPAVQFTDALGDSSLSLLSPPSPPDRFEPTDSYQVASLDPPIPDSSIGEPDSTSSQSFDPAVQFGPDISERTDSTEFIG